MNSQYDHSHADGMIAQLVEHCTGIAEVMGLNPVQAFLFFSLSVRNCLSYVNNYDGLSFCLIPLTAVLARSILAKCTWIVLYGVL